MQHQRIISEATRYWASYFGCSVEGFFAQPLQVIAHSAELAEYEGIFALFRNEAAIVSLPPGEVESLRRFLPVPPLSPRGLAQVFQKLGYTVVGPAYIGYTDVVAATSHPVRSLGERDAAAARVLRASCGETEWEHGGSSVGDQPCSGVYVGNELVALAGYEVWGGTIAHISVITHPASRRRGFGRSAVAHIAGVALSAGLIPQYRTLESNRASIRVAGSVGFLHYATSVAVGLNRGT